MSHKVYVPQTGESWDEYWSSRTIEDELNLCTTDELKPIFLRHLSKKMKILEAGSGLGKWVITLTRMGYKNVIGLDNYEPGLKRVKKAFPETRHKLGDVTNLPFDAETFDAYVSLGVIEHFEEGPGKPLQEAYRVLKKGGLGIIEVPYDNILRKIMRVLFSVKVIFKSPFRLIIDGLNLRERKIPVRLKFYEYRYTKKELGAFLKNAGFILMKMYPKDDNDTSQSIGLWLDFPRLRRKPEQMFVLNNFGRIIKKVLRMLSRYSYSALIVAVVKK